MNEDSRPGIVGAREQRHVESASKAAGGHLDRSRCEGLGRLADLEGHWQRLVDTDHAAGDRDQVRRHEARDLGLREALSDDPDRGDRQQEVTEVIRARDQDPRGEGRARR